MWQNEFEAVAVYPGMAHEKARKVLNKHKARTNLADFLLVCDSVRGHTGFGRPMNLIGCHQMYDSQAPGVPHALRLDFVASHIPLDFQMPWGVLRGILRISRHGYRPQDEFFAL